MNEEAILAVARKIIEANFYAVHDEKLMNAIHSSLVTRFFNNIHIEIIQVGHDDNGSIIVDIGIETKNFRITAAPHKFQTFSVDFKTERVL